MTVQEAIKNVTAYVYMECENMPQQVIKALDVLKDSAKECEQYREFGTPTQILERIGGLDVELGKYACIGTVEELKEAMEKQIPKKPIIDEEMKAIEVHYWNCPSCKTRYGTGTDMIELQHCHVCGQKIDWGEEDD